MGWRCLACCPQSQTGSPTQTNSPVTKAASPPPLSPRVPPTTSWLLPTASPSGPPCYPNSLCTHKVGKDSLKCYTCSKWVHFSCSSQTWDHFYKICVAGSTMGWNCPVVSLGTLPLPPIGKPPLHRLSGSAPSHTPPPTCSHIVDSPLPLPSHPPLLNTYPLSAFTLPFTPPPPTSTQPTNNSPPPPQRTPHPPQNLRILQWNAGGLSPSRRAELIAFLSNHQYDLILLQETHLSATKKFQIPGYSTLRTDRTFGKQGPVSSGGHNTGGGVLTLSTLTWPSLLFLSPLFLPRTPTQATSVLKFFFSNHSPLQFLNLYSPPIRSTPSDSRTWTFSPDILPNSLDTFILGDFNVHHPTWDSLIPLN